MSPDNVCSRFFILACALLLQACADPGTFGPWAVGHQAYTVVDNSRADRSLLLDVWYPVDPENALMEIVPDGQPVSLPYPVAEYPLFPPFGLDAEIARDKIAAAPGTNMQDTDWDPSSQHYRTLVVFSHGYGGTNTQSTVLMETLASHGFIVVSPEHTGNTAMGPSDPYEVAAANRVPDVSFVIDTMLARAADPEDKLYRRINPLKVAVVGHSFGGATAVGSVSGWAGAAGDSRVAAIVPISPAVSSFTQEQFDRIDVPVLLLGGTLDTAVPIEVNNMAFESINGDMPVYNIAVEGATHTHFANICAIANFLLDSGFTIDKWEGLGAGALLGPYNETCSPDAFSITEVHRIQNQYVVAFLKAHLDFGLGYFDYLSADYALANEPDVIFQGKNLITLPPGIQLADPP